MREVSYWEADDGTVFEDESECREYEWKQNVEDCTNLYTLLDSNREKLDPLEPGSYDDCYYIFVANEFARKKLQVIWDDDVIGVYAPDFLSGYNFTPGLWAFDDDRDEWYHLGEKIAELQDIADSCMAVVNGGL